MPTPVDGEAADIRLGVARAAVLTVPLAQGMPALVIAATDSATVREGPVERQRRRSLGGPRHLVPNAFPSASKAAVYPVTLSAGVADTINPGALAGNPSG